MTARESRESGRKEQILESALHLFLEEGYDSTSMRKIADAAGCAIGLAYHYFETKDEMFAQTLDYFFQPYEQEMRVLAAQKDKDLYGLLEDCFSYTVKQISAFRKNHALRYLKARYNRLFSALARTRYNPLSRPPKAVFSPVSYNTVCFLVF